MYTPVWMCESCKVDLITEIGIVQGLVVIHTNKNTLQYKWQGMYSIWWTSFLIFVCHTDVYVSTCFLIYVCHTDVCVSTCFLIYVCHTDVCVSTCFLIIVYHTDVCFYMFSDLCMSYKCVCFYMLSSTNKTDNHDITEILLKVVLNTTTLTLCYSTISLWWWRKGNNKLINTYVISNLIITIINWI